MKKTVSLVLAVLIALAAALTISVVVFAEDGTPSDNTSSSSQATSAATSESATAETRKPNDRDASSSTVTTPASGTGNDQADALINQISKLNDVVDNAASSRNSTTLPNKPKDDDAETVTLAPGQTAFVNDDAAPAPTATKAPAVIATRVPNTGSGVVIPAVAVLALLAGTVAVVTVKKNEEK